MTKIQPVYPLKTPMLKVRVVDDEAATIDHQKAMLEKGAIFEFDQLVWAKEKCLASAITDEVLKKSPTAEPQISEPHLVGALVSSNETSTLHVFEASLDQNGGNDSGGMRFKMVDELELPLFCEQHGDRYLGGVVRFGKFIFVGVLMCKVKICDD